MPNELLVACRGITLVITLIACVAKILPGTVLSKLILKKDWRFCSSMGILMNTRGLVELIALNTALDLVRVLWLVVWCAVTDKHVCCRAS